MSFSTFVSLEKHLDSLPSPPKVYCILAKDKEERKLLALRLANRLTPHVKWYEEGEWALIHRDLATPSLFGETEVIIWDIKKIKEEIVSYTQNPYSPHFFILLSDSLKGQEGLKAITLNLLTEKPWDKDKRVQEDLLHRLRKGGKSITPQAAALFLQLIGGNEILLEGEAIKLLLFTGERKVIEEKDVHAIVTVSSQSKGFQIAEGVLWGIGALPKDEDASFFFSLLGQLRFLLYQIRGVESLLLTKTSDEEIGEKLHIRSKAQLQKLLQRVKGIKIGFASAALHALYQLETIAKSSSLSSEGLLRDLTLILCKLRKDYAR